jgi:nitrogen regulatory protein PII
MSDSDTSLETAVLITIIGETVLKDPIIKLLKSYDVSGYTITQVQGEGGHGRRLADLAGYNTNIEIKTIVSLEVSDAILSALKEYQGKRALIAFRHNIEGFY